MVLGVCLVAMLATPSMLRGHGALKRSAPAANDTLRRLPAELLLEFTESVEPSVTAFWLVRNGTDTIPLAPIAWRNGGRIATARVLLTTDGGTFAISWRTVGVDGHPVRGVIPFVVADSTAPTTSATSPGIRTDSIPSMQPTPTAIAPGDTVASAVPSPLRWTQVLRVATRWVGFVATVTMIGAAVLLLIIVPSLARQGRSTFAAMLASPAALIGVVAGVILVLADGARLSVQLDTLADAGLPTTARAVLESTTWGTALLLHLAAALLATLVFAMSRRPSARIGLLLIPLLTALAVGAALAGHAAAATLPIVAVDALHVIAGGAWIGTLILLVVVVLPRLRSDRATGLLALSSFSRVALVSGGLLVVTGVFTAWSYLGSVAQLTGSSYGRILLLKLALFVVVAALGLGNQRAVARQSFFTDPGMAALGRRARLEVAVALLVLVVTAVLVAAPLPTPP